MTTPTIAILGRPNVGKSTLFNRLLGRKRSLVNDTPGVTRDRIVEEADWWIRAKLYQVRLVDTGGLGGEILSQEIQGQVEIALAEANLALMVFDGQTGFTGQDQDVLRELRKAGILDKMPVIGVVNKVDDQMHEEFVHDFYASGLDQLVTVSAEHGDGVDDLQEKVLETLGDRLPAVEEVESNDNTIPKIAIVGRPNVGKSTLLNAILGQQRMITSPMAGTTVDAVDSLVHLNGKPFLFIDTAGIRRKSKTQQGVEVLSVIQARKSLERADLAILVLDGKEGPTDQDEKIAGLIQDSGCSVIIAINKWDVHRHNPDFDRKAAAALIREEMGFLNYAPILFISALEKRGLKGLDELIGDILHQRRFKIPTHELSEWVRQEAGIHNPDNAKFFLCHQSGRRPPTFSLHVNEPKKVHFSLQRHLVNAMRDRWGFMGTPLRLRFVKTHKTWKESRAKL